MEPMASVPVATSLLLSLSGAAQRVFLYTNNPTPCYNSTVDLICYYPDVMERVNGLPRYIVPIASWRVNGEFIFPDEDVFDQRSINQTATRLRVKIDPANFTGNPVSFTCYLPLTRGGEDSASTVVDPQGVFLTSACTTHVMMCCVVHVLQLKVLYSSTYTFFLMHMH